MAHTVNGLNAWGGPVAFTFHVTADQVKFIRDVSVGLILFVDIQPGMLHTYYVEIHSDLSYLWYIDGGVVNSGTYPGAFPSNSAAIQWWTRCFTTDLPQTAKFDYIRYGV